MALQMLVRPFSAYTLVPLSKGLVRKFVIGWPDSRPLDRRPLDKGTKVYAEKGMTSSAIWSRLTKYLKTYGTYTLSLSDTWIRVLDTGIRRIQALDTAEPFKYNTCNTNQYPMLRSTRYVTSVLWVTELKLSPSIAIYVAFTMSAALHPKVSG